MTKHCITQWGKIQPSLLFDVQLLIAKPLKPNVLSHTI